MRSRMTKFALVLLCPALLCPAQSDPIQSGAKELLERTHGQLSLRLEERTRWEEKYGNNFGLAKNQQDMLSRIRIGLDYRPSTWFTIAGTGQDARAPWYGPDAPSSTRDPLDLQEAWAAFAVDQPFRVDFGRRMINYGETRAIGTPQWTNTSRTYDFGRTEYSNKRFTLDVLMFSPVIVNPGSFNRPELGNRYWGTYDVFSKLFPRMSVDIYALRHSENKIGGWTGTGTLRTDSYGVRFYGSLPEKFTYSLEGIDQGGHAGPMDQHAYAWSARTDRQITLLGMPIDLSAEYKEASGSHAGATHNSTFDQLSPSNHDKFGHEDLFGWKNLRTFKTLETVHPIKPLAFNVMYTNDSLFSASDGLYSSAGSIISVSNRGIAGRGVGQELDAFTTYTRGSHALFAGFGHFFRGQFVVNTTPGINSRYFYMGQQYTLK